ncbi:MAG TPA: YrdB family protein [Chitinophagaceae bacterium]|jgi:hypothetical protein|nr:YrdB family protein [Chitinophagaceae bacterium]HWC55269.1 YrdB family protein [Chitinophagaceae bacterium]
MSKLKWINLGLRAVMEAGIVITFGYWGYETGKTNSAKIILCIVAPLVGFGFWGLVDFHQFNCGEMFRLIQELLICGLAVIALYKTGSIIWAWAMAILSVVYHILVYVSGERLLKRK